MTGDHTRFVGTYSLECRLALASCVEEPLLRYPDFQKSGSRLIFAWNMQLGKRPDIWSHAQNEIIWNVRSTAIVVEMNQP